MKLSSTKYPTSSILGVILALSGAGVQAGTMGATQAAPGEKIYIGIFGGGGSSNQIKISQYGTAFFSEADGGPLAVNAFGQADSRNVGIVGAHLGYQWGDIILSSINNQTSLSPAIELEGYYLSKSSFTGHDINNETTRLPEHDFLVTYPMSTGVFLANTILNFNSNSYAKLRPYVGAGIGAAVLSISNADSLQLAPMEPGVNHYNGNPNDKAAAFAAQTKVGLNYVFNDHLSVFAEYRWLYISDTNLTFGSTVYSTHAPTSSWNANLGSQNYNMGAGGIRFTV
jgi:opacity protein-like surface antigen